MSPAARAAAVAVLVLAACAGGPGAASFPGGGHSGTIRSTGQGRPPLSAVTRAGDAQGAIAVAVTTEGIAPERGAVPGVSLAALVEARMADRAPVTTVGGWGGWRIRALVASVAGAPALVDALREAMLTPVTSEDAALAAVRRKVDALAQRPLPDRAMIDVPMCTGEAFGLGGDVAPTAAELEGWRKAAQGLGRVAFGTAGDEALAAAVADALARGPVWPSALAGATSQWPASDAPPVVYDASSEIAPGAARIVVTARTSSPERAVASASNLGDARGPLASRLAALDAPARIRSVVATAHPDGGCLAATVDIAARDLASNAAMRIATAAALARQEMTVELADTPAAPGLGAELALRAADPRDAAERAAWWALAGPHPGPAEPQRLALSVGLALARDAPPTATAAAATDIRAEIDRATIAWHAPVVDSRTRVERGQGEAWILLASTCGTTGESNGDAGSGAAVATAAAMQAGQTAGDAQVEPFTTLDGLGVLAHGPAHPGESPLAQVRRLADLAARSFAADALEAARVQLARSALLVEAGELEARLLGATGGALAPGHPSWVAPLGTRFGLASISDDDVALRAMALRSGPLRVAVLANVDDAQADAAVRAVDRWIARRPGEVRACPPSPAVQPHAGTYAVDLPAGARSEALVVIPLPSGDDGALAAATWTAAALDGPDGFLTRALLTPGDAGRSLAVSSSARVLGRHLAALVARVVVQDDASLDAAVAQTRALLDRLRQGAIREEDRARAAAALARASLGAALDPRARVAALWRGESAQPPSLDALRAFASAALREDQMIIVAARPPRAAAPGRPAPGRDPRARTR